ncbi:MAG: PrkA family serine protein kinase, partial [Candidatus Brocadiales bacterium]|nr:PrkA family serine protein kinase [Candidatus Brocadiales bacterium]
IYIVKVPYCLRVTEEVQIYEKLLRESSLADAPCTPKVLEMLAQMSILTRLKEPENSSVFSKMRTYDGESLKDIDPNAKSMLEYKDYAGVDEGISGLSTRFAFKVLSKVLNYDSEEVGANPVHLLRVLEDAVVKEQFSTEVEEEYISFMNEYLKSKYADYIGNEIQIAFLESYSEFGQNLFDRYIDYADHWIEDNDYKDHDTGEMFDRSALNDELEKIEKAAGIANPKDFRSEVVNFALRHRAGNDGLNPDWTGYEKLRVVIEKKMFSSTENLLPVVSFTAKQSEEDQKKHDEFVERMKERGYSPRQTRLLTDWYQRVKKTS